MIHKIKGLLCYLNKDTDGNSVTVAFDEQGVVMELIRWSCGELINMQHYIMDNEPEEDDSFSDEEMINFLIMALSDAYTYDLLDILNPSDHIDPFDGIDPQDPHYG